MTRRNRLEDLVVQMQNDFLDIPALELTLAEARQRFDTDDETCEAVLDALVDARVLARAQGGTYQRFFPHGDSHEPHRRMNRSAVSHAA